MPSPINKIFVYGTLLQGEIRSTHMSDCMLLTTLRVPGILYDTGRGYPAAVFDKSADSCIYGELYQMSNPVEKLKELDEVEAVNTNLFEKVFLNSQEQDIASYEAGEALSDFLIPQNKITEGNWRRYSSLCFHDPLAFALSFEERQKFLYREPATMESDGLVCLRGDIPILITVPHSTVHKRLGKLKRQEFYTGALAVMLHSLTGCHVIYTNRLMESDPNYYDESPFKNRLSEIIQAEDIRFLIDLHGTGPERKFDIYPGVGVDKEFLLGLNSCLDLLEHAARAAGISVGGLDVLPASKQMTVAKYGARKLKVPSMQLEINRKLRQPEQNPHQFISLVKMVKEFLDSLFDLVG